MDEMNLTLPPILDSALSDFYTAPQPTLGFADRLERQLLAQFSDPETNRLIGQPATRSTGEPKNWSAFMQTLRARPALVLLLAILTLALLTGAAYAIGRLSGFIPGFGFTTGDPGSVYMLAEPVEITHERITLRILQATSDLQRFSVTIEQRGQLETNSDFVHPFVTITLPNGEKVEFQESTGSASEISNSQTITFHFNPLPLDVRTISLHYEITDRDQQILWQAELPLHLRPLRVDEIIPPPAQDSWQPIASENQGGLSLVLENVAAASDKTILQVALRFDHPGTHLNSDWNATLSGADGAIYPLTQVMNDSENRIKTYETIPFKGGESLTLSLTAFPDPHNLPLSMDFWENAPAFTFDPGANPQAGQTWQMDETLSAGSFPLKVTSAQLTNPNTLVFTLQSDGSANGAMLYSEKASGSRGGMPTSENTFSAELIFAPLPTEPFEIHLVRVNYTAQGEWNFTWQAPAAPSNVLVGGTNTPAPTQSVYTNPTPAFSDPLCLELVRLTESFDAPFQQGPGWVHYVTETETTPRAGQNFPPPYIKSEQWLEIDEAGYITRTLHTDYDEAGNIIQRTVTVGDYFINFTVGDSGYLSGKRYRFSSSSLLKDLNDSLEYNDTTVIIENILCGNDSLCYLVAFLLTSDEPAKNTDGAQSFTGHGRQVWIDKKSGQMIKSRSLLRFPDGTEQVDHTYTILLVEKVDTPPQDVLDILEKVVVP